MYLFITTILIAELIIAGAIINFVYKFDKKVINLSDKIEQNIPKLKEILIKIRTFSQDFAKQVNNFCEKLQKQREQYFIVIIQDLLIYFLIFYLKRKKRKYASVIQLAYALKECWSCN